MRCLVRWSSFIVGYYELPEIIEVQHGYILWVIDADKGIKRAGPSSTALLTTRIAAGTIRMRGAGMAQHLVCCRRVRS